MGSAVELKYDHERTGRCGRTLAAVYRSGSRINAEIARKGLGVAVVVQPNREHYDEVILPRQQRVDDYGRSPW